MPDRSRTIPFVIGAAIAISLFALFGWDLAHHYVAYSPNWRPSPWGKLMILLPWAAILGVCVIRWFRKHQASSWPSAASRVESGSIKTIERGRHSPAYLLNIAYSYSVDGETYGGVHSEVLATEPEAQSVLASLQAVPPPIRYKPDNPMESEMFL